MPLDLSVLAPDARASYIRLGRQWSSTDTLAQANQTLIAFAKHGADIAKHGFVAKDGQRLQDARDALVQAGVDRSDARGDKKVTGATYVESVATGKAVRDSARAILQGTRATLLDTGGTGAQAGVKTIDAALQQTRAADDDAEKLATQLDLLRGALSDANVTTEASGRGGTEAVADLKAAADALRAASAAHAGTPGTAAETEQLDVLDGIIVTLARNARKAGRAAAKRLGKPAIAADFELTKLYSPRHDATSTPTNGDTGSTTTTSAAKPAATTATPTPAEATPSATASSATPSTPTHG
jgi:hypothetical protein